MAQAGWSWVRKSEAFLFWRHWIGHNTKLFLTSIWMYMSLDNSAANRAFSWSHAIAVRQDLPLKQSVWAACTLLTSYLLCVGSFWEIFKADSGSLSQTAILPFNFSKGKGCGPQAASGGGQWLLPLLQTAQALMKNQVIQSHFPFI